MDDRILYLSSAVAVAWLVTFALRSLPFVVFAGKKGELPPAVERAAAFVSPVIIAGLIAYSYWGLYTAGYFVPAKDWAWPLLAGILTVCLHLWKGNALASILAGTVLYMSLLGLSGCATVPVERVRSTVAHPLVRVTGHGVEYRGRPAKPHDLGRLLERDEVSKTEVLHVLVEPGFNDAQTLWVLKHNCLDRAGYTRSVFMNGERRGVSGKSDLRESFESKGTVIPYEKRFQKRGGSRWK